MDSVEEDVTGWWFWDETWADRIGPYKSEEDAREALELYCKYLETGDAEKFPFYQKIRRKKNE